MAVGFSRDRWYNYIADRSHPPVASAVVEKPEWDPDHVYAWKPTNNWKGWKRIDKGEAGVDDSEVIQKAIDSLTPNRTWKKRVVLKGDFYLEDTITLDDYTILDLSGSKLKLKDGINKSMITNSDLVNGNKEIEIIGGVIDGNKTKQTGSPLRGIYLQYVINAIISKTKVQNCKDRGIEIAECQAVTLDRVVAENCGVESRDHNIMIYGDPANMDVYRGIQLIGVVSKGAYTNNIDIGTVNGVTIIGGLSYEAGSHDIGIDSCRNIKVVGFKGYNAKGVGIAVVSGYADCGNIEIDAEVFNAGSYGFRAWTTGYEIRNLTIRVKSYNSVDYGIGLAAIDGAIRKVRLIDCVSVDSGTATALRAGFVLDSRSGQTLEDVQIINPTAYDSGVGTQNYAIETWTYGIIDDVLIIGGNLEGNTAGVYRERATGTPNIKWLQVKGYTTKNSGTATFSGDGSTTTFTIDITHGLVKDKLVAKITLDREGTVDKVYLVDKDGDGFKETLRVVVTYATAPADGEEVPIYWEAEVV